MKERHIRSIGKTVSYRVSSSILTVILVYVLTGSFPVSLTVGGLEIVAKLLWYYFHERIWNVIDWGKEKC